MKILFIGNSYTFFNKMPETFRRIAESEGENWEIATVLKGGWSFDRFANPEDVMYAPLAEKLAEKWDVIFMQEQSTRPVDGRENFLAGAEAVRKMMDVPTPLPESTRIFLYVTWGRADGSPMLETLGMTRLEMSAKLLDAYTEAARRIGAGLSDVGSAFVWLAEQYPAIPLYDADTSHPSPCGSFVAARVHYRSVTGKLPAKIPFAPENLTEKEAKTVLEAVKAYFSEKMIE